MNTMSVSMSRMRPELTTAGRRDSMGNSSLLRAGRGVTLGRCRRRSSVCFVRAEYGVKPRVRLSQRRRESSPAYVARCGDLGIGEVPEVAEEDAQALARRKR